MTIVSLIPPIVDGDATVRDADDPLSVACYWVLPFVAPGLAMLVTSKYPDWFVEASGSEEAVPAAAGPPDRLSGPVDDAVGLVVHLEPADVLADETAAVHVIGAPLIGPSASAPKLSMPSGIAGGRLPRPTPTSRERSSWLTRTLSSGR
jgi:hypothetical protein